MELRLAAPLTGLALLLCACRAPGFRTMDSAAGAELPRVVPITAADVEAPAGDSHPQEQRAAPAEYRLGAGDVVAIALLDNAGAPDPRADSLRQSDAAPAVSGPISASGTIFFPYAGSVQAAGLTVDELRAAVATRLAAFFNQPQVNVRVLEYRSQRVLVSGQVKAPGLVPVTDLPLTLLEALARSGGPTPEADLESVSITRDAQVRTVSLRTIAGAQDPVLRAGDVVTVPDTLSKKVHVMGEVRLPSTYPMTGGRMTLADALGTAGGIDSTTADPSHIFVFRREQGSTVAYMLDSGNPAGMVLAAHYLLKPQDVVYVAPVSFTNYNRALARFLPTLQALWQTAITSRELR